MGQGKRARARHHARLLELGTSEHYADPLLYDLEYAEQREDVDWYCALADHYGAGKTILELGAGTGRVTIPVADAGHHVRALDRMEPMLDHLALKLQRLREAGEPVAGEVEIMLADMCDLPLAEESVGLVIAPFNCLMHLYTWRELLTCFREVHRVLEPGGRFGLDVLLPDLDWLRWDPNERYGITEFQHPRTGERMIYSTNHSYDPQTQVCHVRIYYDRYSERWGGLRPGVAPIETIHLAHRQIFPEELRALLGVAGFEIESHGGDFLDLSLSDDIEAQTVVCRKP